MKIINAVNKSNVVINKKTYYITPENEQKEQAMNDLEGVVLHWTAGTHSQFFDGYHFNVGFIDNEVVVLKTLGFNQKGKHLWGRNSGMVGVTLCAMKDWIIKPNKFQVDMTGILVAEICAWKQLKIDGTITLPEKYRSSYSTLSNTGKMKQFPVISDHRLFAVSDGYDDERQDILDSKVTPNINYYEIIRNKAIEHYKQLKANKKQFVFKELLG